MIAQVNQSCEVGVGQRDRRDEINIGKKSTCEINLLDCGQCNIRRITCTLGRLTLDVAHFGSGVSVQTALQLLKSHAAMAVCAPRADCGACGVPAER
jgi:hypothetical protein